MACAFCLLLRAACHRPAIHAAVQRLDLPVKSSAECLQSDGALVHPPERPYVLVQRADGNPHEPTMLGHLGCQAVAFGRNLPQLCKGSFDGVEEGPEVLLTLRQLRALVKVVDGGRSQQAAVPRTDLMLGRRVGALSAPRVSTAHGLAKLVKQIERGVD
eukprot:scaffold2459_cov72-Phaeocystis_antarctica.AAC.8